MSKTADADDTHSLWAYLAKARRLKKFETMSLLWFLPLVFLATIFAAMPFTALIFDARFENMLRSIHGILTLIFLLTIFIFALVLILTSVDRACLAESEVAYKISAFAKAGTVGIMGLAGVFGLAGIANPDIFSPNHLVDNSPIRFVGGILFMVLPAAGLATIIGGVAASRVLTSTMKRHTAEMVFAVATAVGTSVAAGVALLLVAAAATAAVFAAILVVLGAVALVLLLVGLFTWFRKKSLDRNVP